MPCCRRKRNRLATAPRARQGVNLTRGVGRSVLLIYAPVARSRGLLKESWTFLSFVRRNNLATETSQRRVKRASASTSSRWLPAALFLLLFYASSGPAASSQLHAHTYTRTRISVPPRFDDGSLPPRRVSTGRRFEPRPFSTFTYLLRPLVTPPP